MTTEEEIAIRRTPRTGEEWLFGNGVTATIGEISDPSNDVPEIAYIDPDDVNTVFKFNDMRDPLPVRKVGPQEGDAQVLCQYDTTHFAQSVIATTTLDCGETGNVPACQECSDFHALSLS